MKYEADMMDQRREGRAEGIAEGRAEGIAEGRAEGRTEGRIDALSQSVQGIMRSMGKSAEEAMDLLEIGADDRARVLERL